MLLWLKVFTEAPTNSELCNISFMIIIIIINKITGDPRLVSAQIAGALRIAKILKLHEHGTPCMVSLWVSTAVRGRRAFKRGTILWISFC